MQPWDRLPEAAEPEDHLVQLYGHDHQLLASNVGRYFRVGLRRGDGLLAIATLEHCHAFARELRQEPGYQAAVGAGRLVFLDAELVLAASRVNGALVLERVEDAIISAIQRLRERVGGGRIRAFGELVGILWAAGQLDAALRLEHYWNQLLRCYSFGLFCGYPIDRFDPTVPPQAVDAVLCAHTHVVTPTPRPHSQAPAPAVVP